MIALVLCIQENGSAVAGIFEDDIFLGDQADLLLRNIHWVPENAHVIKTEKFFEHIPSSGKKIKISNELSLFRFKKEHLGTAGYIVTNKGAEKLLRKIREVSFEYPLDKEIFDNFLQDNDYISYQTNPAVCIQDFVLNKDENNFPSDLSEERELFESKNKTKKSMLVKIPREIFRPLRKLFLTIKNEKIKFYN